MHHKIRSDILYMVYALLPNKQQAIYDFTIMMEKEATLN